MKTFKMWDQRNLSLSDFPSTIVLDEMPNDFIVPEIQIAIQGNLVVSGGTTDWTALALSMERLISEIRFYAGANNLLKSLKGYECWFNTVNARPALGTTLSFLPGDPVGVGTFPVVAPYVLFFSDPLVIESDKSALFPKLYENIRIEIDLNDFANLLVGGDRTLAPDFTFEVMILQENNPTVQPSILLREYGEEISFTATGNLAIELPRTEYIGRFNCWPIVDDQPNNGSFTRGENVVVSVNNGQWFPIEAPYTSLWGWNALDQGLNWDGDSANVVLPINLDANHDLFNVLDNRTIRTWNISIPVTAVGTSRYMRMSYVGRTAIT